MFNLWRPDRSATNDWDRVSKVALLNRTLQWWTSQLTRHAEGAINVRQEHEQVQPSSTPVSWNASIYWRLDRVSSRAYQVAVIQNAPAFAELSWLLAYISQDMLVPILYYI